MLVRLKPAKPPRKTAATGRSRMPIIVVDGKSERLSPGARIKNEHNLLVLTAALAGKEFVVNYKRENIGGMVSEVWILSSEEAKVERKNPAQ